MVQDSKANLFGASPTYQSILAKNGVVPREKFDLSSLESVTVAGSPVTPECQAWFHDNVKKALVESDERSTSLIFRTLRNTSRVYGNSVAKKAIEMEHEGKTIQEIGPIVAGARGRVVYETGDMEHGIWSAGTVMGIINDVPSCKELVERIVAEAEEMIRGRLAKAIAA